MEEDGKNPNCRIIFPDGKSREYSWKKLKFAAAGTAVIFLAAACSAGYFYNQLHD